MTIYTRITHPELRPDPLQIVPVASTTLAEHNNKQVVIKGSDDKWAITATFTVTLNGQYLGMQLTYGGKTNQSLGRFDFPTNFSLSVNKKHYSNKEESMKFIKKILVRHIESEQEQLSLPHQEALTIFDVFKGQVTRSVLDLLKKQYLVRLCSSQHDIDFPTTRLYCEWVRQEIL